ncbi:MAG: radical SAM protein [Candidatus Omnitrophota bacterium]
MEMNALVDGTIVREEPFGFFIAFADGHMGFFDKRASSLIEVGTKVNIPQSWFSYFRKEDIKVPTRSNWNYQLKHPLIVTLELTRQCNCKCDVCYIDGGEPRPHEMSDNQLFRVLEQLVSAKVSCVQLNGGEPLLHPLLPEIISYLHNHGIVLSLVTNGILLNETFIKTLPRKDFGLGLSVDSYAQNHIIRGDQASFDALKPNVRMLRDYGIPFHLISTLSKQNIHDVLLLIEWCRKNDVMLDTLESQPLGRARLNDHLLLDEDDLPMHEAIYRGKQKLEDEYEARHDRSGRFFSGFLRMGYLFESLTRRCMGGRAIGYITSEGILYPCSNCASMDLFAAGNVTENTFEALWSHGFSQIHSLSWDDFNECKHCDVSRSPYLCTTRCPALSYSLTHELTHPGCTPYMKKVILNRTRIHEEMHAEQHKRSEKKTDH